MGKLGARPLRLLAAVALKRMAILTYRVGKTM
jgi:hypothetical protein